MSIDTAISKTTLQAVAAHNAAQDAAPGPNDTVITAIRGHHDEMAAQLGELTAAVLSAAAAGDCTQAQRRLHDWYRTELLPHAVAEERALYSEGAEIETMKLLICAMLAEHRQLVSLIAELALAHEPFQVATVAAAAQAVFTVHLGKENDLLLPALDQAGVDLATSLDGMHEVLGQSASAADEHGCGCGCSHDGVEQEEESVGAVPVQLLSERPAPQPEPPAAGPGELDVRRLPHGQRHEIIFAQLNALAEGEALVIVNDHDPKPLRYQTAALWPDTFEWTYREAGPQVWRVAITRVG
ncbi:MAG TPA: DUF2249 domain-containing protein [Jatrophihabitantaceae bacterium]|jgi:uncharacterized protein (DUF2249 family)|nr:DUF2249 domain-containing protein [Jatrophihabitantaceae bacterium]